MTSRRWVRGVFGIIALGALPLLSACTPAPMATGFDDPDEAVNRAVYAVNQDIDRAVIKPLSSGYGNVLPPPIRAGMTNVAANLALPSVVANSILQGRIENAVHSSVRFLVNTTLGLGGLIDVGSRVELEERDTDFGETLHVWGMEEGDYVVLPLFGPSTERDMLGRVVDLTLNPAVLLFPPKYDYVPAVAEAFDLVNGRYVYSGTYESVFNEGEDPYVSAKMYYLETRRQQLGGAAATEELYDLYDSAFE